jgi:hypothetical protein
MTSAINDSPLTDFDQGLTVPQVDEPPARRQPGQLVELWLDGADEPVTVSIDNRDRIAFEKVQTKRGWPKAADAQNLAMTFVCWSAAKRAGLTTATYEQFEAALVDYDVIKDVPADPTR